MAGRMGDPAQSNSLESYATSSVISFEQLGNLSVPSVLVKCATQVGVGMGRGEPSNEHERVLDRLTAPG